MCLVTIVTRFYNEYELKRLMYCCDEDSREQVIREKLPIPVTNQNEVVALMKPVEFEIFNWFTDHRGIFTVEQEWALQFCWDLDGTINRTKTADSIIHSDCLDEKTRLVLACQYLPCRNAISFFNDLHLSTRMLFLEEYLMENGNRNIHEKNVEKLIRKRISRPFLWTSVSLQSGLLDNKPTEYRESLLEYVFEDTHEVHIARFCLSRLSADQREALFILHPLKILRIYLLRPYQKLFLDMANRVCHHLSGNQFHYLLHIIICQKIVARWNDFDYVNLLRQFWQNSIDYLKEIVDGTEIFEIMKEILNNRFPANKVPRYFLLHEMDVYENANACKEMTSTLW
ncbi:uncharacterized protein TNCT_289521 [Trichonephila clavata]|uniref:Uncharacterized protein n=1 Tax=Trichonephila clavata TaxID=2740835 RepID=A0A8X6HK62_TRICU|nr:uncharacterized protein TNCT_289521 [Trichonephila clavata]